MVSENSPINASEYNQENWKINAFQTTSLFEKNLLIGAVGNIILNIEIKYLIIFASADFRLNQKIKNLKIAAAKKRHW